MKVEEIKIETVQKIYVAEDGAKFTDENECRKYEQTAKQAIEVLFGSVPQAYTECVWDVPELNPFSCDVQIYAVKPKNVHDIDAVNRWLISKYEKFGEEMSLLSTASINRIVIIECAPDIYYLHTPKSLKNQLLKGVDSLCGHLLNE